VITIHEIIALSAMQGLINAFDMPGRQSFLVQMVEDRADLGNAIALNSSMVNVARMVGPALAGLVIGAWGEGYCFLIDGLSYIAVVVSLAMMNVKPLVIQRAAVSMLEQMKEGWTYVSTFRPIRTILMLFGLLSLMGWPFMVLLPVFASNVLHGGPHTLAFLTAASGIGALGSAVSLAVRKSVLGLTRMIQWSAGMLGVGLILFGLSHVLWLSMVMLLMVGYGLMQCVAASNTVIQTLVPEDKRSRVMSYYTMAFVGMAPFGSLLAGGLAHYLGAPRAVMITGACCVLGAVWFAFELPAVRKVMRPIYVEMGILPVVEEQG
jgi:MFS family permease